MRLELGIQQRLLRRPSTDDDTREVGEEGCLVLPEAAGDRPRSGWLVSDIHSRNPEPSHTGGSGAARMCSTRTR
ncbi:hypothetical protein, partial [Candidatus Amarobacter glycogenicus]|uniref:hypothetical protein n=1 Tax=Candidatus Amarobacter glycogenicus TaxID=3140699 RepID=UPI0031CC4AE4